MAGAGVVKGSLRRFAPLTTPAPAEFGAYREDADLWSAWVWSERVEVNGWVREIGFRGLDAFVAGAPHGSTTWMGAGTPCDRVVPSE